MTMPVVREQPAGAPSAAGLETLCLANADLIDRCQWVPTDVQPGTTPLPIYPAPNDLAIEVVPA